MRKHYVTFVSPGTFFAETTRKEIASWDTAEAARMAGEIVERHGARPYGFHFTTEVTRDPVPDGEGGTLRVEGRQVAEGPTHFLGGEVLTYDQIEARRDPKESILLSNMRGNRWPLVIENRNSYRSVQPFEETSVVVDPKTGAIVTTGADERWVTYRREKLAEWDAKP